MSVKQEDYGLFFDQEFRYRWLSPDHLYAKLEKFRHQGEIVPEAIGLSEEEKPIYALRFGNGKTRIMIWSQMHGNEPTATMALIDLFNFISVPGPYKDTVEKFRKNLSILFIPMLNPDGAARYSRRNALGIDLNRDAMQQASAEIRLLAGQAAEFKPQYAFNLHDQRNQFSVEGSFNPATISFLAPSYNHAREINTARENGMKLIGRLRKYGEEILPGHFARFTDEFYARAIGEYFQQKDIPCILVESGAYPDDPFRDMARKLNFFILIRAFEELLEGDFLRDDITSYQAIPANETNLMDIIFRKCQMSIMGKTISTDLGLRKEYQPASDGKLMEQYFLRDLGDLGPFQGYREISDCHLELEKAPALDAQCNFTLESPQTFYRFKNGELDEEHKSL